MNTVNTSTSAQEKAQVLLALKLIGNFPKIEASDVGQCSDFDSEYRMLEQRAVTEQLKAEQEAKTSIQSRLPGAIDARTVQELFPSDDQLAVFLGQLPADNAGH